MPPLRRPLGVHLADTAKAVSRAFDDALAAAGGSRPTWLVLIAVKSGGAGNQRELADAMGITAATLTHHLDAMESAGLLTRRRDPGNRRVHLVELTAAGEAAFRRLRAAAVEFDERLRAGIGRSRLEEFEAVLDRLAGNVAADVRSAGR